MHWLDEFMECESCRAKPGSPYLCASCLHNRRLISIFKEKAEKAEQARSTPNPKSRNLLLIAVIAWFCLLICGFISDWVFGTKFTHGWIP